MNAQKLAQLQQGVRIGGPGTMRRKRKNVRKRAGGDDKTLQATLKKLGAQNMQGIEEVNMFKDDGTVIQFAQPKFQVVAGSNMYVVSGRAENKKLTDILPGILKGAQGLSGQGDEEVPDLVGNFSN
eukprot:TRINITY_DN396_c0_g1_i1.p1 TRINITY_DN396_c0_g1~~TRINITY_DN396_c0_g1_i1.p1  ORF type:complete len:135 (+),score=26.89 TRINITY_DN396_c0_g1_i1:28-405(+)